MPWQGTVLWTLLCFGELVVFWGVAGATLEYQCCSGELVLWWGASAMGRCSFGVLVPWQGTSVTRATAMVGCRRREPVLDQGPWGVLGS